MMKRYNFDFTPRFNRDLRKLIKKNDNLHTSVQKSLNLLKIDYKYPGLKSHIVDFDAEYGNIWSSRVTGDIRIIWAFSPDKELVLILLKIGGHDYVY